MKVNDKYLNAAHTILNENVAELMVGAKIPEANNDNILDENATNQLVGVKIPSVYNGYVSAFGGSMVQPGLFATVLSYYSDEKKVRIAELIYKIYLKVNPPALDQTQSFLEFTEANRDNRQIRNKIAQSVIALKLVLRTYAFDTENEQE